MIIGCATADAGLCLHIIARRPREPAVAVPRRGLTISADPEAGEAPSAAHPREPTPSPQRRRRAASRRRSRPCTEAGGARDAEARDAAGDADEPAPRRSRPRPQAASATRSAAVQTHGARERVVQRRARRTRGTRAATRSRARRRTSSSSRQPRRSPESPGRPARAARRAPASRRCLEPLPDSHALGTRRAPRGAARARRPGRPGCCRVLARARRRAEASLLMPARCAASQPVAAPRFPHGGPPQPRRPARARPRAPLSTIAREWTRIGLTGFGGPPAHVVLLRRLVVDRRRWMDAHEFEDANAACGLLPGPASTQLAIFCAYRVGGPLGRDRRRPRLRASRPSCSCSLLSVLFFGHAPPLWVRGAGAGAGAAVAAVAVHAARSLLVPSFERVRARRGASAALGALPRGRRRGRRADRPLPRARAARRAASSSCWSQRRPAACRRRALGAARRPRAGGASPWAGWARSAGRRSRSARSPTAAAS